MRATEALIHLDRLRHNLAYALRLLDKRQAVCVAVKANAYGHGLVAVGQALQRYSAAARLRLGVATVDEAVRLREAAVSLPIWLFSYAEKSELPLLYRYRLEPFVGDVDYCREVIAAAAQQTAGESLPLHIKIDSGMGRIGCRVNSLVPLYRAITAAPAVRAAALCTHLADAYDADYTAEQYRYFDRACAVLISAHPDAATLPRHAANSAAILIGDGQRYEAARPGIMMYGYDPDPTGSRGAALRPVMELRSKIVALKSVEKGAAISYGMTWRAPKRTRIATIPIGYGDGYACRLSGAGASVLVQLAPDRCEEAPIVGRVCMDQLMVDVGHLRGVARGQTVVLFGDSERRIGADQLARQSSTIAYEITTAIQERVPRRYR